MSLIASQIARSENQVLFEPHAASGVNSLRVILTFIDSIVTPGGSYAKSSIASSN